MNYNSQEIYNRDNFSRWKSEFKTNWYVFYTSPRAEKRVHKELINSVFRAVHSVKGGSSFLGLMNKANRYLLLPHYY